jgi:hypothetical protein
MNSPFVRTVVCALALGSAAAVAWAALEGRPCSAEPTDMLIEYGDVVTCEIAPVGDLDLFRFQGQAGEKVVALAARQVGGGSPCLELRGPAPGDPPVVGLTCDYSTVRLDAVLPASGLFTLRVNEFQNDAILSYGLTLERVTPPSPAAREVRPNCTVTGMIDPIGDLDIFSFTGAAGDTVVIQAMRQAGGNPCVQLFGPTGALVSTVCGNSTARLDLRLVESGVHTILVSESLADAVLDYALYFECLGTCEPTPPTDFYTVTPCRVFDTRELSGPTLGAPLACGTAQSFTVAGKCGVPASATAVSLNLTGTGSIAQGNLRLFAAGCAAPLASTLNYAAGQTRANNAVAPSGDGGRVSVLCSPSGTTHVVLDVNGYFQ